MNLTFDPNRELLQCLIIHQANPIRFLKECFRFRRWTNKLARKSKKVLYFKPDLKLHCMALDQWAPWSGWDTYLYVVHRPHFQNEHFLLYFSFSVHDSLQTCALKQKIQYNIMAKIKTSIIDEIRRKNIC